MLIQRAGTGTLPPPGFSAPAWSTLAAQWNAIPAPETSTVTLGPCMLEIGQDDAESDDLLPENENDVVDHIFGWDNESPKRCVEVKQFKVEWRPITNGEFLAFWSKGNGSIPMPPSWVDENGEIKVCLCCMCLCCRSLTRKLQVRTLYGGVSMEYAQHWPCLTAYDDLLAYARSKGGRIPTEHELRLFLDKYQVGHEEGANVGFRNWHPLPYVSFYQHFPLELMLSFSATAGLSEHNGRGSNGGVWEWSSDTLDTHPGFDGTTIFPGYSSDFFDGKHQVVVSITCHLSPTLTHESCFQSSVHHTLRFPASPSVVQ